VVSANDDQANIWRAITNGAMDYLLKPVRLQQIRNIWQHVFRKNIDKFEKSSITKEILTEQISLPQKIDHDHDEKLKKEDDETKSQKPTGKKTRFTWTPDHHHKFISAIQELGERGKSTVLSLSLSLSLYIYIYILCV
jgi:two-component response regulator (ARR-B family)